MKSKSTSASEPVWEAVEAVQAKKAQEVTLLELKQIAGFTDYFLICTATSSRQVQAIADEAYRRLSLAGLLPAHVEGYNHAEWVLMDYVDFVVHIFSQKARAFYDLERLWRTAHRVPVEEKS